MKVERYDGNAERRILSAMIASRAVLGGVASRWDKPLFESRWANVVGGWCVAFFRKHAAAPKRGVESLFERWADRTRDEATVKLVEEFLTGLSGEFERAGKINTAAVVDEANQHFNRVRVKLLAEALESCAEAGDMDKAKEKIAAFDWIEMGDNAWADALKDEEVVLSTFAGSDSEAIVRYPGALGEFFGETLCRDGFVAFLGPEKSGKTFWLIDLAIRAAAQRRKVAFFEVGDMSQRQIMKRFCACVAKHPTRSTARGWPCKVKWPTSIKPPEDREGVAEVEHKLISFDAPLDARAALEAMKTFGKKKIKSDESYLYLNCFPCSTANVDRLKTELDYLAKKDFVPAVIVIDYADILAPPPGRMEVRDGINATWKQLRSLSQELHCLVVTATQSDTESYDRKVLDRRNFSEDKRKLSHATGLVGINVTSAEKERQLTRLNWVVLREAEYSPRRCVHCAGCLPLAKPAVLSCW